MVEVSGFFSLPTGLKEFWLIFQNPIQKDFAKFR